MPTVRTVVSFVLIAGLTGSVALAWPTDKGERLNGLEHWAWRKPTRPPVPPVKQADWPINPIDAFVLARLEAEGLTPSSPAERYVLCRRVYLDLIGLPPTPEQLGEFIQDNRPDAYKRLVDRLLDDPAYGERWARMWLDLARYADSKGYGSDPLRTIWRYRDWVINAFNRNMPFDQFTLEQLAGDMLPNPTSDQLLATAFHRNTMSNDEGGTDDELFRVEAVKDRADTTMQVWMGLTFGCAKCHSHKFDPISQRDYYQLFAFFNQTEDADRNDEEPKLRTPTADQQERLARLRSQIAELETQRSQPSGELATRLEASQREWEESVADSHQHWTTLEPQSMRSEKGTEFEKLSDGSVIARGPSPDTDSYTFEFPTPVDQISGLRLEVLPHDSLPGSGPGRASGGNFVVTDLRVTIGPTKSTVPGVTGRYVRVELPGEKRFLSLAEVQVFQNGQNVAPKGKATQSSTDFDGPPERAIDGNTNGHYFEAKSTTHTKLEDNPWWEVDLGSGTRIDQLALWNRSDGGLGTRLSNFRVTVLDDSRQPVWESKVTEHPNPSVQLSLGGPKSIPIKTAAADFEQDGFPATKAIDGDASGKSGWAVGGQLGKPHELVFEFIKPIARTEPDATEQTMTVTIVQSYGTQHTIGRLRVSAASASLLPAPIPASVRKILAIGPAGRSAKQKAELARFYQSIAPEMKGVRERLAQLDRESKEIEKQIPTTPVLRELPSEKRRPTHVLAKANFMLKGDAVNPAVPSAFHPMRDVPAEQLQSRVGLAAWLTHPDNPLTARVAVNRLWSQLFGRGLVFTEEDFGTQGLPPTHPELLDWLACEFMAEGDSNAWDMKRVLRLIVTSATYRQTSAVSPELLERDPDNAVLSRGASKRLDAEQVRDQALELAGLLSRKVGGPSVYPPQPAGLWRAAFNGERTWPTSMGGDRYRRGIYTFWRRTVPYPSMATFDAPSREICTVRRIPTNTPLQAFVTLNDPVYVEAAQALARRIVRECGPSVRDRAAFALELCLARPPSGEQINEIVSLYETELKHFANDQAAATQLATDPLGPLPDGMRADELAAWTVVANVCLNLDGVLTTR